MKKIELKSRKLLRWLFGCVSFTAVAFVFQACYGVPRDDYYDVKLTGTVKSKTTDLPVKGIKVVVNDGYCYNEKNNYGFTDENGNFNFYASVPGRDYYDHEFKRDSTRDYRYTSDSVYIHFLDIDGLENGDFEDKTIIVNPAYKNEVRVSVALEEKQ